MSAGYVILPVTPECLTDADPRFFVPITERWLDDWCADHGVTRLEGPAKWREEQIEPHFIQSALIWPAEL